MQPRDVAVCSEKAWLLLNALRSWMSITVTVGGVLLVSVFFPVFKDHPIALWLVCLPMFGLGVAAALFMTIHLRRFVGLPSDGGVVDFQFETRSGALAFTALQTGMPLSVLMAVLMGHTMPPLSAAIGAVLVGVCGTLGVSLRDFRSCERSLS
jgi:hypothetical protein